MAVTAETVRATFDELRQALKHVIDPLLAQDDGGHYTVALLVAIGSEALSRLQGRTEDHIFVALMTKRGLTAEMARDVFKALRHGIAHTYDTKFIQAGRLKVELIVSWRLKTHLSVRREPPGLFLNVRTMWEDLRDVIEALKASLPPGGTLPDRWVKESIHQGHPHAVEGWRQWITTHESGD